MLPDDNTSDGMERRTVMRAAGLYLLLVGILLLALAIASGEAKVALVLIIPIIYGSGALAAGGILLIFAGIVLMSLSYFTFAAPAEEPSDAHHEPTKKEYGGVILIGPIPIVFGSARSLKGSRLLLALAVISLIILILYLIIFFR
jgi:uncharacterized protein (TIGR00304 family)